MPPKNCAIYTRVSTVRQAVTQDGSLDGQVDRLKALVHYKNQGVEKDQKWHLVDSYVERGESGKGMDRPELQRLIQDIKSGKVNCVITTKIDRISRSLKDFYDLWDLFEKYQATFLSEAENFDTSQAMGRAMLKIILVFAELERETTAERTAITMAYRATQGLKNGGRMWGYNLNPEQRGLYWVNEEEASNVRTLFAKYLELGSVNAVVKWTEKIGICRPEYASRRGQQRGGGLLSPQGLINLYRNPFYIGKIRHKGQTVDGQHKGIIPIELWDAVQSRLGASTGQKEKASPGMEGRPVTCLPAKRPNSMRCMRLSDDANKRVKRSRRSISLLCLHTGGEIRRWGL